MKQNKFTQTEFHNLGITLVEYNLLKKYVLGYEMLIRAYQSVKKGIKLHQILDKDILNNILKTQEIKLSILNKVTLPFKNIKLEDLKIAKAGHKDIGQEDNVTNTQKTKGALKNIIKIKDKPIIINCYSKIGDTSLKAGVYLFEKLTENKIIGRVITGLDLNRISVDFDNSISYDLLDKDFLLINSFNSIYATDYRKQFIENLFEEARLKNKPIILTNNEPLINKKFKVFNLNFLDNADTHSQVLKEFLED